MIIFMKKPELKRSITISIVLIIVLFLMIVGTKLYFGLQDISSVNTNLPGEYKGLFKENVQKKIDSCITFTSNIRSPISMFHLNHEYAVVMYKLGRSNMNSSYSIKDIVKLIHRTNSRMTGVVYHDIGQRCFDLKYKSGKPLFKSKIYLNVEGESIETFRSKSLLCYSVKFNSFSINYKLDNSDTDLLASSFGNITDKTMSSAHIVFMEKNNFVYVLILSNIDCGVKIDSEIANNLIVND